MFFQPDALTRFLYPKAAFKNYAGLFPLPKHNNLKKMLKYFGNKNIFHS